MKKYISATTKPKLKIDIVKCYDVSITDENGYLVSDNFGQDYHEMVYGDKAEATRRANLLLKQAQDDLENGDALIEGIDYDEDE